MGDKPMLFKTIELRCQATRRYFGLWDHYFLVIDDKEIHLGLYEKGKILPKDTTKGSHIAAYYEICKACYDKIILDLNLQDDERLFKSYFPFLNCETLCTGFSFQSLMFLSIPFIVVLLFKGYILWAVILSLATLFTLLAYSKFTFSRTRQKKCQHLY